MPNENTKALNQILRGEHMAIGIYDTYINILPHGDLRLELTRIKDDHERHARELAAYVEQAGGTPVDSSGMAGSMADFMGRVETLVHPDPQDILQQLYDGEDKGLARAVQYSEHKLSREEQQLLDQIFSDEHDHLKQLQALMSKHGHSVE